MAALLAVLLAAGPVSLASPDFDGVNVPADVARFCNEHLAQQLTAAGLQVITARQIAAMLGLERQRQLLGCSDGGASCMAESANALGAEGLVLGDLGRLGAKYQLNVRIVRAATGQTVATWSRTVAREDDLLEALTDAAAQLAPRVQAAFRPGATPAPVAVAATARRWPWVPTGVAGALAVAGGISFGFAAAAHAALTDLTQPPGSVDGPATRARGELAQGISTGAFIGAAVALAVAGLWYLFSGTEAPVRAALVPGAGGGRFTLELAL